MILVGGVSSRMGTNKALLPIGGISILQRVVTAAQSVGQDVLLITGDPEPYRDLKLPTIPDIRPHYGPLMGLFSGLMAAQHELALLLACDMPFVSGPMLHHMVALAPGYDIVIPRTEDGLHPLYALYRRSTCLPAIEQAIDRGQRRMVSFFGQMRLRELDAGEIAVADPAGLALMNVNTPADLAAARAYAAGQGALDD